MFMPLFLFALFQLVLITSGQNGISYNIVPSLPISVLKSDHDVCTNDSELYVKSVQNFTLWATEMWDATAKSATGTLRGSIFNMGHFDQCLSVKAPFPTQYCLTTIKINVPKPLESLTDPLSLEHDPYESVLQRLYTYDNVSQQARNVVQMGWCLPASCTYQETEKFLNQYLGEIETPLMAENITYTASLSELVCNKQSKRNYVDSPSIIFCIVTSIIIVATTVTTIYDIYVLSGDEEKKQHQKQSVYSKILFAFSAKRNYHDLKNGADGGSSNDALTILYGMRTICILMIILDHRFGTFTSSALLNFNYVEELYRSPYACFVFHGDLFVDSFFLLSGLLVAYGLLNQLDKKPINPGFFILLRYIRLTPVYAFVIFYYATLFGYSGSGPLWKIIAGQDSEDCKANWWTNLLYISNYVNADHMCMTHSWYLPCDFHYFIIGIGVCILIRKDKKLGLGLLLSITIISCLIPFVLTLVYRRPALLYFYPEFLTGPKKHPDFLLTYSKSHTRATPYFIGMFAGYFYHKLKGSNTHVCRTKSFVILAVSIVLILISILSGAVFYNPYHKYNALEAASYAGLHRPAFAIGTAGILFVTSYGHAKIIYRILAWKPWIPISKLTYGAYLIHMQFQLRSAAKFMNPQIFDLFSIISLAVSDMTLAFITAFFLYLCVEAPFRNIFKQLMFPPAPKEKPQKEIVEPAVRQNMINNNNPNQSCDSRL